MLHIEPDTLHQILRRLAGMYYQVDVTNRKLAGLETSRDGVDRHKTWCVLLADEALFFRGGDNFAVNHQSCGRLVLKGCYAAIDTENFHG